MPELIDKAKLLEYLAAIKPDEYVSAYGEAAVDVINHVETYVSEMPTISPEVRHGRWKNGECTNCKRNLIELCGGEDYELARFAEFDAEFCPFCGARMYGGADNGNKV